MEYQSNDEVLLVKDDYSLDKNILMDHSAHEVSPGNNNHSRAKVSQQYLKMESQSNDGFIKYHSEKESLECTEINIHRKNKCNINSLHIPLEMKTQNKVKNSDSWDSIPLSQRNQTWLDYNWRCNYCESLFPTIDELQTHSIVAHNACNPYRCTDCNFRKARLDKFLIHVKSHHKQLKYSCYKCLKKFNSTLEARRHNIAHADTKFSCEGCKATFVNSVQQKLHSETFYIVKKNVNELPQMLNNGLTSLKCSKTFKTKGNLKSHYIAMHTDRKQKYVCEACGKGCYDRSSLAQHVCRDDRPFKCHVCKLGFKTAPVLRDHIGRHNNVRPFSCDQCGSSFRLLRDLKKHSIVHSDVLLFQCSYCEKSFQRKQYLTNHERLHTGEKPYSCEICQHCFSDWPNYNKHMKQRHNIDTSKKKSLLE